MSTVPQSFDKAAFDHFLKLAQRGQHGAASGGEVRAYQLAKNVVEHIHGLDGTAIEGLKLFIDVARACPSAVEECFVGGNSHAN